MAQKDKERYIQEYMAYQETDSYKDFMRKKFPGLSKSKKLKKDPETIAKPDDNTEKVPLYCTCVYDRLFPGVECFENYD